MYEAPSPRRLEDVLRALPAAELEGMIHRLGVPIVAAKKIDTPSQVARALVSLPEVRDPTRLSNASAELLHRIAESRGLLVVQAIPPGLEPLVARGIVFARVRGDAAPVSEKRHAADKGSEKRQLTPGVTVIELVLPYAHLVQLRSWEGEDPRGLRALIAQAPFETASAIASHYLGRSAPPPVSLVLELAWEVLSDPVKLAAEVDRLAPAERKLLEAIDRVGGEVDTEELLDLEREPMRLRGPTGATPSRRGVGFALERRGLLIPVHPNRHVVPTEVAEIVGAARQAERESRRARIRTFVLDGDHAPRRARFAGDPAALAVALAIAVREPGVDVRAGVGTPRSLVTRFAQRFGREPDLVAFVSALSRAIGLWDPSALSAASPPGTLSFQELGSVLYTTWWRGGAWDEARPDPEILRQGTDARDPSPARVIREMVVDSLRELGEGRWLPWEAVARYVRDDMRTAGVGRLLRRWADRIGVEPPDPVDVARRIALESLPALGVVDQGVDDANLDADPESEGGDFGPTLRLTARGRALLAGKPPTVEPTPSRFIDGHVLRVGPQARLGALLALVPFVEVGKVAEQIDLVLTPAALARALSAGVEPDLVRGRIEAIAPLPEALSRIIAQASVVVGKATFVPSTGFLWVEDPNVCEMLRTRRQTADLFLDPSPSGGLLVAPGVELDKVARRCRALGVEVVHDGQVVRARSTMPPPAATASGSRVARTSERPR